MSARIIILVLLFVGTMQVNAEQSQSVDKSQVSKQAIIQNINRYNELKNEMIRTTPGGIISWPGRVVQLENENIDVLTFSNALLNGASYVDFWSEAIGLKSAKIYMESNRNDPELVALLCDFLNRKEDLNVLEVLESKITALVLLSEALDSDVFEIAANKEPILNSIAEMFGSGNPTEPVYWLQKWDLVSLSNTPKDDLDETQKKQLHAAVTASRYCVYIFANLHMLTGNSEYEEFLKVTSANDHPQIVANINWVKSSVYQTAYKAGKYNQ